MFKKLIIVLTALSVITAATTVISQPKQLNPDKTKIAIIQKVIEATPNVPTKDEIADRQIEQRKIEIALQNKKEKEAQEALNKQKQTAKTVAVKTTAKAIYTATFDVERWRPIVAKYPWPVEQAMLTMKRESGGNPYSVSRTDDHGLFQIHRGLATYGTRIYDPEFNIKLAYENYYAKRGWRPWYAVRGILW